MALSQPKKHTQRKGNTVSQSISFEKDLFAVMEANRAKLGLRQYRTEEVATALEFYYAATNQLPRDYQPQFQNTVDEAKEMAKAWAKAKGAK